MGTKSRPATLVPAPVSNGTPIQAPVRNAPEPEVPTTRIEPEEFTLVIYIDRGMELKSMMTVQRGTTVLQLKQRIAADDPTGMTQPDQFSLKLPNASTQLADMSVVMSDMT